MRQNNTTNLVKGVQPLPPTLLLGALRQVWGMRKMGSTSLPGAQGLAGLRWCQCPNHMLAMSMEGARLTAWHG